MGRVQTFIKLATVLWFTITIGNRYQFVEDINESLDELIDLIRGDI